jgi:hypothetical protein
VRLMLTRVDDDTSIGLGLRLAGSRGNRRHPALPDGQGWRRLRLNGTGGAPPCVPPLSTRIEGPLGREPEACIRGRLGPQLARSLLER